MQLLNTMLQRHIALPAIKVALIVGTLLNIVNQGARLFDDQPLNLLQLALNYFVPFCVSSYSAALNEMRQLAVSRQHSREE